MLQIRQISKQYQTGELVQHALDDVSLNLRDNEFVAILGPSGSGKTTLLNIIGGLDRYDSGDLVINGTSTKEYNDRDWDTYRNHSIGFVFQSYNLIPHQNVLANVELALTLGGLSVSERKARAKRALEQVGLGDQIHKKPNQMSGGQMQRVALARALVNDPDILLADEPTGALDTETSVQVMDLIREVAKDRLVVMVTHNPELAEEYASRIVRLKDGKITDDSMPYTDAEVAADLNAKAQAAMDASGTAAGMAAGTAGAAAAGAGAAAAAAGAGIAAAAAKKGRASMSFLTSLGLSFSNLRTKKGRTILTSFAGSIGIIGIALILSLSTGVNQYIDKIQRDTMASYPITVSATSFDLSSIMTNGEMANYSQESEPAEKDEGKVYASFSDIKASTSVSTNIKENNLTEFKQYLDDPNSEIQKYIGENGIVFTYNVDFKVYSYDDKNALIDSDADLTELYSDDQNVLGNLLQARSLMMSNMSTMFGGGGSQNAANFSEMMSGANGDAVSALIKDNYDVVYGNWPDSYDEVVLVLNNSGKRESGVLYQLGLVTKDQYAESIRKMENEEEPEPIALDYRKICDHIFYLITASDLYEKNESGNFVYTGGDEKKLETTIKEAVPLRIVGIVKPAENSDIQSLETAIGYTTMLTDFIVERSNNSEVIKAQKASPETDILTGQAFMEKEPEDSYKAVKARDYINELSEKDKSDIYSTIMVADYEGAVSALMSTQLGSIGEQLTNEIGSMLEQTMGTAMEQVMQNMMMQVMNQLANQLEKEMSKMMEQAMETVMTQVMEEVMAQMAEQILPQIMESLGSQIQTDILPQVAEKILPQIGEQFVLQNLQKVLETMQEQLKEEFPEELKGLLEVNTLEELKTALNEIDFESIDYSKIDFSKLDFSDFKISGIDFSKIDFSVLDLSGLDFSNIDFSQMDFSKIDFSGLDFSGVDLSGLDLSGLDFSGMDLSGLNFSGLDLGNLGSSMSGISDTSGNGNMADTVQYWLDNVAKQESLAKVFDQLIGVSNYDNNMKKFGYINYDAPSMVSLYADSFEGKDGIAASIQNYNETVPEDNKITYTDYVALLTTSITTIINAISYVLIGFVAVSLFVSCIMIGIITNISVLERTKEIGVLRALGASKRNISNVFNAETFIIGGFSGLLGVGVSLLLTVPINAIIHTLMGSTNLSANLPPLSALILVLISIVITMIGGLIPAGKASRQDPVVALRSE